jgi:hypothetical protein
MGKVFAFHVINLDAICYGRMAKYMYRFMDRSGFDCKIITSYINVTDEIPMIFFDQVYAIADQWDLLTSVWKEKFILIESEPIFNLTNWMPWDMVQNHCRLIVTLNCANVEWFRRRTDIPVCLLKQGYIPEEDLSDVFSDIEKVYDIVMPGCTNSPDRIAIIRALNCAGMTVNYDQVNGYDLDIALACARIFVYYPASEKHYHYPTQRILWALNKGACVVAVESTDKEMEDIYGPLYVRCAKEDVVETCKKLLEDDTWEQQAQRSLREYKQKLDGYRLFQESEAYTQLCKI